MTDLLGFSREKATVVTNLKVSSQALSGGPSDNVLEP
jgi:hypothetical protein